MSAAFKTVVVHGSSVSVETHANGYRTASVFGAHLTVRPDGSESHANVKDDSGLYAQLNAALFAATGEHA